jgi:hypothetical protein
MKEKFKIGDEVTLLNGDRGCVINVRHVKRYLDKAKCWNIDLVLYEVYNYIRETVHHKLPEENLKLYIKPSFPEYKFEIGDIVKYAHYISGEERLYEVVERHRGTIHNRYTLVGAHDHRVKPSTFVKQENLLKLYMRAYNYKSFDTADCARCAYKQSFDTETLNGEFYRIAGIDVRWLKYFSAIELDNDLNDMEKNLIHFGE